MTFVSTTIASNAITSGDEQANLITFVKHIENRLLSEWNCSQSELDNERILIRLLHDSVTELVQDFDGAGDDLINFVLE